MTAHRRDDMPQNPAFRTLPTFVSLPARKPINTIRYQGMYYALMRTQKAEPVLCDDYNHIVMRSLDQVGPVIQG